MDPICIFNFSFFDLPRCLFLHPVEIRNQTFRWKVLLDNFWIFAWHGPQRVALLFIRDSTKRPSNVEAGAFPLES